MDDPLSNHGLIERIEALLMPSVVLLLADETPFQTGFFVSSDGLICTCYHGFDYQFLKNPGAEITAEADGRRFRATILYSSESEDFTLLAVGQEDGPGFVSSPLPIWPNELPTSRNRHKAVSIGCSGLGTDGLPSRPRLFNGELAGKYEYKNQERFDIYNIGQDRGNSGAPVMDLQHFRVLGYIQSSFTKTERRLGAALTLKPLLVRRPDLRGEWELAGERFDRALADHYRRRPFSFDLEKCPDGLIEEIAAGDANEFLETHRNGPLFKQGRYVDRAVEPEIDTFIAASTKMFLLLTGAAGSGKTSLLLNLARKLDRRKYVPAIINCEGRPIRELLPGLYKKLLPTAHASTANIGQLFNRCKDKTWCLLFDGLDECRHFKLEEFCELINSLQSGAARDGASIKVIISLRAEFLRAYFTALYFGPSGGENRLEAQLLEQFHRTSKDQPYVDIGRINSGRAGSQMGEIEMMYERYRETGLKPITSFEQLKDSPMLSIIDRPFILELVMDHYNGKEIPVKIPKLDLLRDIVREMLRRREIESSSEIEHMLVYLRTLANFILGSKDGRTCSMRELQFQPWHKLDDLRKLLDGTPLLEKKVRRQRAGDRSAIGFGADWIFEYFLAQYLWEDWWEQYSNLSGADRLAKLHSLPRAGDDPDYFHHFVVALVFFADWAMTDDPARFEFIVEAFNDPDHARFAKSLIHELLDFMRFGDRLGGDSDPAGSASNPFCEALSSNSQRFNHVGAEGFLEYVEHLESLGEYTGALRLLNLDAYLSAADHSAQLRARHSLSLAFNTLHTNNVEAALGHVEDIEPGMLSADLNAKHAFVTGRAYQYKRDFQRAKQAFECAAKGGGLYSYMCEHQLAFIRVIAMSDFAGAAAQLENVLKSTSFEVPQERRLESRLLNDICRFRIGDYASAEKDLREIVSLRTGQRNHHKLGTALRALAEIYLKRFERDQALETVEQAIKSLKRVSYKLSLATALDTKANILGLLDGDLQSARRYNVNSLKLTRQKEHETSKLWFMHTSALLSALDGDVDSATRILDEAGTTNPFESLQRRFIIALARVCGGHSPDQSFEMELEELGRQYHDLKLAWYPTILSLMLRNLPGRRNESETAELALAHGLNPDGLVNSHLYARISGVR